MSATIKDVAKMAGVSISTVSRVINDSKPVSPEVRKKVLDAIEELDYKPNQVARSLVTRKSNLIGIIMTDIGNAYMAQMIRGIEEVGRMYNYDILLSSSYGNANRERELAELLKSKQVEGIIFISEAANKSAASLISEFGIPFVYLNKYYADHEFPSVTVDDLQGSEDMVDYLQELGHRKILYITSNEYENSSVEKQKIEGYRRSINKNSGEEFILSIGGYEVDDGYNVGNNVVKLIKEDGITAVFCRQDEIAIGLINYCYDNNIRVPEDISICGYGDTKISSIYRPKLTTVREPYYDMGAVAIRKIIKEIDSKKEKRENIYLPLHIIERESCSRI